MCFQWLNHSFSTLFTINVLARACNPRVIHLQLICFLLNINESAGLVLEMQTGLQFCRVLFIFLGGGGWQASRCTSALYGAPLIWEEEQTVVQQLHLLDNSKTAQLCVCFYFFNWGNSWTRRSLRSGNSCAGSQQIGRWKDSTEHALWLQEPRGAPLPLRDLEPNGRHLHMKRQVSSVVSIVSIQTYKNSKLVFFVVFGVFFSLSWAQNLKPVIKSTRKIQKNQQSSACCQILISSDK